MIRIVKSVLIISFILLIEIVYSCCGGSFRFRWTDLNLKSLDNSGQNPIETTSKHINKNAYGIRIEFQEEQIANHFRPEIISSAMATSCDDDYIYIDTIKYLRILSNADFDENHLRNTDLSSLFKGIIPFHKNYYDDLPKDVEQVIKDLNQNNDEHISSFDLFLLHEPKLDSIYCFTIEIGLNNNSVLTGVTDTLVLR
jgi:hypothetical protein